MSQGKCEQEVSTSREEDAHIGMRQITFCSPQGLIIDTNVGLSREIIPEEHCKEFWPRRRQRLRVGM